MSDQIQLDFPATDIARLRFDTPGRSANILSATLLAELSCHLDVLEARDDLAGLILASGKSGTFIAGADLTEFAQKLDYPPDQIQSLSQNGQQLFRRLARFPGVTVCAIDGVCVGGGAEMAVWCDRRLMTDRESSAFGFPEVKLGIIPGWGGTVRTPRIVGLGNAVELITGGETIDSGRARLMGLVTDIVPLGDEEGGNDTTENASDTLTTAAISLIRDEHESRRFEADRKAWAGPVVMSPDEASFLALTANAIIQQKTKGQYTAPGVALETILEGALLDEETALAGEREALSTLWGQPQNRALLNVFFLTDRNKKDRGSDSDAKPLPIERLGVVGAGLMGAGIAGAALRRGLSVTLVDANGSALAQGTRSALNDAAFDKSRKGPDPAVLIEKVAAIRPTGEPHDLNDCDLIVEAIVENFDAKRSLYERLAPTLANKSILASNTSSLPISRLAQAAPCPERFVGMHFFNPVNRMQLVEVIRGEATGDVAVATVVALAKHLKKMPIVVGDGPGFLVNRLLFPYMNEAIACLTEGIDIPTIDRAAKKFGMPMGPFELYDLVGLDTAAAAGGTMADAFPDRYAVSTILPGLVGAGRLGQKSGRGFYEYQNKKQKPTLDPELEPLLKQFQEAERIASKSPRNEPGVGQTEKLSTDDLALRLILPMLVEATRIIEAGLVRDVRDIDLGVIYGLGFPPFRGGLLFWADSVGPRGILEQLAKWQHLGPRFEPTRTLRNLAERDGRFYDGSVDERSLTPQPGHGKPPKQETIR